MYSLLWATVPLLVSGVQQAAAAQWLSAQEIQVLAGAPISDIKIEADNLVQCQTSTIKWTGANVSAVDLGDTHFQNRRLTCVPRAQQPVQLVISTGGLYLPTKQLEQHDELSDNSFEWQVTQPEGTGMFFLVSEYGL